VKGGEVLIGGEVLRGGGVMIGGMEREETFQRLHKEQSFIKDRP